MARIEVEFDDKKIQAFLKKMSQRADWMKSKNSAYVDAVKATVITDIDQHFKNEEGPSGKWPEWSINYIGVIQGRFHFRSRIGSKRVFMIDGPDPDGRPHKGKLGGKILQDTGRLRASRTYYRKKTEGIEFYRNAKTRSGFPYAAAHDKGGPRLPQRRFMWLSKKATDNIAEFTLKYLLAGTKGSTGGE